MFFVLSVNNVERSSKEKIFFCFTVVNCDLYMVSFMSYYKGR